MTKEVFHIATGGGFPAKTTELQGKLIYSTSYIQMYCGTTIPEITSMRLFPLNTSKEDYILKSQIAFTKNICPACKQNYLLDKAKRYFNE